VANLGTNNVSVISAATNTVTTTIVAGSQPVAFGLFITGGGGGPPPPLTITTSSPLPAGTVGASYSQTFAASGGTPPYSGWVVTAGALPAGLTLNAGTGTLSGPPTVAGASSFTVQVTDSATATASKAFTLTIAPIVVTQPTQPIPTLSQWGIVWLAMLLVLATVLIRLRRR
jgi:YVTN family beta-propeller protein